MARMARVAVGTLAMCVASLACGWHRRGESVDQVADAVVDM